MRAGWCSAGPEPPELLWDGCGGCSASILHPLLVTFSVNIGSEEITCLGLARGERRGVTASRGNFSLARPEMAALFAEPFQQGSAVPVFDQRRSGGKPIISFHSFAQCQPRFTNSSISHLLKSTRTVCKAAALLISDQKGSEGCASLRDCGTSGGVSCVNETSLQLRSRQPGDRRASLWVFAFKISARNV